MREIGDSHNATVSQVAIAYAINKGTNPIIGVTKPRHVEDATAAVEIRLNADEIQRLEKLGAETGVDTKGSWEIHMN